MDMFKKITFVRFCFASAYMLEEDLGLPTEKLICLNKECIEMAKHCNDVCTMVNSCTEFAWHSNSIGRHADSLSCLKEILPTAVVIPSYELIVHKYLSFTYNELKEFDNVVLHAKKGIEIARTIGNKEMEIHGHREIANAFLSLACYDDAIDCGKKCLEVAQEYNSAKGEMLAYDCISFAYKSMQKYDDTILYAVHKLLDCATKINDHKILRKAYLDLGRAHLALNHYQDATDFAKKCIQIAREIEDRCGEVRAYILMGEIYNALSDYDNAIIYYNKCIELAITIGNKRVEAHVYWVLGNISLSLGKYDDAISNCNKYLQIDKDDNEDKAADVIAYLNLGIVNKSLEKYDEAIQNYKQCIDIVDHVGQGKEAAVTACLCLGVIYETLKQYNDAVYYSKKCIDMAQETGEKSIEAQACLRLLCLYPTFIKKDKAIEYGKKCLNISQETDDKKTQMEGHYHLAQIYLGLMQLNDMSLNIDAGMAIATELGDKKVEEDFKATRYILYQSVGLVDKACDEPSIKEFLDVSTCSEDDLLEDLAQAVKAGNKLVKYKAFIRLYRFYRFEKDYEKTIHCLEQLKGRSRKNRPVTLTLNHRFCPSLVH